MDNKTKIKAIKNPIFYLTDILHVNTSYLKYLSDVFTPVYESCKLSKSDKDRLLSKMGDMDLKEFTVKESFEITMTHYDMLKKCSFKKKLIPKTRYDIIVAEPDPDMVLNYEGGMSKQDKKLVRILCDIMDSDRDTLLDGKLDRIYDGRLTGAEHKELFGFDPEEMREWYLAQKSGKKKGAKAK